VIASLDAKAIHTAQKVGEAAAQAGGRTCDVAPDGRRFLMLKWLSSRTPEVFVPGWFEELRRLALPD
jgi:hypothetical protein